MYVLLNSHEKYTSRVVSPYFSSSIHSYSSLKLYCAMTAALTIELESILDFHLEEYFVVSNRIFVICSMPFQ